MKGSKMMMKTLASIVVALSCFGTALAQTETYLLCPGNAKFEIEHTFGTNWIAGGYRFVLVKGAGAVGSENIPVDKFFSTNIVDVADVFPSDSTDGPYTVSVYAEANHVDFSNRPVRSSPVSINVMFQRVVELTRPKVRIVWEPK
jgi:hypothetical protein